MGIARGVCETNAKLATKNKRESFTELHLRITLSFLLSLSDILCFAKSDIIAIAIVILKPYGFSDILFAIKLA